MAIVTHLDFRTRPYATREEKAQLSKEIEQEIQEFLARGGKIQEIPPGVSSEEISLSISQKEKLNLRSI